jgi:hypothetical protein
VPTIVEMTELNNIAQSNYDRFNTATSSPSTREVTTIAVGNPYEKSTRVWIIGQQTNPLYRTYLEHTWLLLEPGEVRHVTVMVEFTLDPKRPDFVPEDAKRFDRHFEKFLRTPNDVGLHSFAEDPTDDPRHALEMMGGAGLMVTTGRATRIDDFGNDGSVVFGGVVTTDDQKGVPEGAVVVTVARDPDRPEEYVTMSTKVEDGRFSVVVAGRERAGARGRPSRERLAERAQRAELGRLGPFDRLKNVELFRPSPEWRVMRAEYLGAPGFAPSTVEWTDRH